MSQERFIYLFFLPEGGGVGRRARETEGAMSTHQNLCIFRVSHVMFEILKYCLFVTAYPPLFLRNVKAQSFSVNRAKNVAPQINILSGKNIFVEALFLSLLILLAAVDVINFIL